MSEHLSCENCPRLWAEVRAVKAERDRLRAALAFYANDANYCPGVHFPADRDGGAAARAALAPGAGEGG